MQTLTLLLTLRIPMRGYESLQYVFAPALNIVTNPHAGL